MAGILSRYSTENWKAFHSKELIIKIIIYLFSHVSLKYDYPSNTSNESNFISDIQRRFINLELPIFISSILTLGMLWS